MTLNSPLIPAKAGTQDRSSQPSRKNPPRRRAAFCQEIRANLSWVPAFAGMSGIIGALAFTPGPALAAHKKPPAPAADPAAASAQLADLDKRITRLEDANQVEIVQRTYGYFVDKAQWTQLSK